MFRSALSFMLALQLLSCATSSNDKIQQNLWLDSLSKTELLLNYSPHIKMFISRFPNNYQTLAKYNLSQIPIMRRIGNRHGIDIAKYRSFVYLKRLESKAKKSDRVSMQESILVADLAISLAHHLRFGGIDPRKVDSNWRSLTRRKLPLSILSDLVPSPYFEAKLELFAPQNPGYQRLAKWLQEHHSDLPQNRNLQSLEWRVLANMERWRWLDSQLGRNYVIANIANATLALVSDNRTLISSRIIIGRLARQTPVFSSKIDSIVRHPNWTVPKTIWTQDILPKVQSDPTYLDRFDFRLFEKESRQLRPLKNDQFLQMTKDQQESLVAIQTYGPSNPLGDVKINFENGYQVYLHDSPNRDLFSSKQTALSSGCIRVQKATELAQHLTLLGGREWLELPEEKRHMTQQLKYPIPIHIVYFTVWIDDSGRLYQVKDLYRRDTLMASLLIHADVDLKR
ncbi:L,D-transpeptidase family protein [Pseudobacteriovorax antillogorgiicola]|uniref:L,D-transpeptidase catalytic domain n=1 Tax=Pseudobacteriovorax antillogorgiicola TaxID=1513793 RepID=A0A1Y6CEQ4_9BACT|nr:L,D-transpeptidase family protein [Pseudobacteriovorax antillogorgiicola]TCS48248.1 L,D-transpeptidase-like protein [Pseudobacteriovorax antillogorgiicola]SMF57255.1 L,D-transpeptidase catalytic domain [Pseudobacteriovorax antillogorgiicola]